MAIAIDQERPISPSLNRRMQNRNNYSNILDMSQNKSMMGASRDFGSSRGFANQQSPIVSDNRMQGLPPNSALMSPSVNQSNRFGGFMNDTRGSLQSSLFKPMPEGRHQLNQSLGGASIISINNLNNARNHVLNSSLHSINSSVFNGNQNMQTPQTLKMLEHQNPAEYKEQMKIKQNAE